MLDFLTNSTNMWLAVATLVAAIGVGAYFSGRATARAEAKADQERAEDKADELREELKNEAAKTAAIIRANKAADAVRDLPVDELRKSDKFERP